MTGRRKGEIGEAAAAEFLEHHGHEILARNYRTRTGEIDLISREAGRIHFVEVKSWRIGPENLEYAIDARKRRRIVGSARDYLARNGAFADCEKQFDVVYLDTVTSAVRYIPRAFEGGAE